jgi:hypothetical protein
MLHKTILMLLLSLLMLILMTAQSVASEPNDYIIPGRALLFNGKLSGVRSAYQTFDNGLKDSACSQCKSSRQLIFLRAAAGTAMLFARDDGGFINSVIELAKKFGIDTIGNYWAPFFEPNSIEFKAQLNAHDNYQIPTDAPDLPGMRHILDDSLIPEIDKIIADLNSIGDQLGNRFKIYLQPSELRIFFPYYSDMFNPESPDYDPNFRFLHPVEVDYGEVLLLKGILTVLKGQLQAKSAYDIYIDANDMLIEKAYGNSFNINNDLFSPHPDLLKVLPTANDSNNGAAILAKARQDLISGINYYLNAINYIKNEDNPPGTDPQDDELLYIDPNDKQICDAINDRLVTLRNSLSNDTTGTYPWETTKIYYLHDPGSSTIWILTLNYDILELPSDEPGTFTASDNNSAPSPWKIEYLDTDGNELLLEMEYDVPGEWGGAVLTGTLIEDSNGISNGTFEYWGPANGTIYNLSGTLVTKEIEQKALDLNPIYGSTTRYPQPVNPRDLLPAFDEWNGPQPDTIGHGLNNDATMGGILPGMTQYDWQTLFDLQPGGLFYLNEAYPLQKDPNGWVVLWLQDQLVFSDISGDTWDENSPVEDADIDKLYMAYDDDNIYGLITLNDLNSMPTDTRQMTYSLYFSYSPDSKDSLDSLWFEIYIHSDHIENNIYQMTNDDGYSTWEFKGNFQSRIGRNGMEFYIPWYMIPSFLPGRFLTINSDGCDWSWSNWNGEDNYTHLKIGPVGTISGTVSFAGFSGQPILVQAYTDIEDPENSVVASTLITEPGPYKLEGIGLGWDGYVRAFTPLFGFDNPFDLTAFDIEESVPVFLGQQNMVGINLVLRDPVLFENGVWLHGKIEADIKEVDWYALDAFKSGVYTIDLTRGTAQYACLTLYGRDGDTEIQELGYLENQQIIWTCPVSGRYYVSVTNGYGSPAGGTYQIRMTTNFKCPEADIASPQGIGVKDCKVDFSDLAALISRWLDICSAPYWCDDIDFNKSGSVNFTDLAILAKEWLANGE